MSAIAFGDVSSNFVEVHVYADLTSIVVLYASVGRVFFFRFLRLGSFRRAAAEAPSSVEAPYPSELKGATLLLGPLAPGAAAAAARSFTLACLSSFMVNNCPAAAAVRGFSRELTM